MADFCRDCTIENFGDKVADRNDMIRLDLDDDSFVSDLCEGCGYGYFDRLGQRVHNAREEDWDHVHWSAAERKWLPGAPVQP